jgi:site-specific DNA-methyltransferase (adenine-specific)
MSLFYEDAFVQLHHGKYEDVLPTIEAAHVVMCDPPYSEHVHGAARSSRMVAANDRGGRYGADVRRNVDLGFEYLTDGDRRFLAAEFARIAQRWVLVFSDVESDHLWREDLTAEGLDYVRTGAWVKVGSTPQFSGDRPATGFEAITIAHPRGRKRWNGGGRHGVWEFEPVYKVPIVLNRSGRDPRLHTTQKPLPLMRALMDDFTEPGEIVLDATAGSGTTGHAAKAAGRRAILIEQSEEYCEKIARRIADVTPDVVSLKVEPDWEPLSFGDWEDAS